MSGLVSQASVFVIEMHKRFEQVRSNGEPYCHRPERAVAKAKLSQRSITDHTPFRVDWTAAPIRTIIGSDLTRQEAVG